MINRKHKEDMIKAISDAMQSVRDDIASSEDEDKNKTRAEAMLILAVAYDIIK